MYHINIICRRLSEENAQQAVKDLSKLKDIQNVYVYQQQLISVDGKLEPYDVSVIRVYADSKIALACALILCNAQNYSYKLIDGEWYFF